MAEATETKYVDPLGDKRAVQDGFRSFRERAAEEFFKVLKAAVQEAFDVDLEEKKDFVMSKIGIPNDKKKGDLQVPAFAFGIKQKPQDVVQAVYERLVDNPFFEKYNSHAIFINAWISLDQYKGLIPAVLDGSYLHRLSEEAMDRVMIEYSQPNTHKAFHVGHMRNCALGDSLIRIYEHVGHPVVGVNYFGDEGAHIAKCLWYLQKHLAKNPDLDIFDEKQVPPETRAEFLGQMYSDAVNDLNMSNATTLPYPGIYAAKVVSKKPFDRTNAPDAPKNWHHCQVTLGETCDDGQEKLYTVVCGGKGYNEGDVVAYLPLGGNLKGKLVEEKDMKGVISQGVMLARSEVGVPELPNPPAECKCCPHDEPQPDVDEASNKKKKKKKKKKKGHGGNKGSGIMVLPAETKIGQELPDIGRIVEYTDITDGLTVAQEYKKRNDEVRATLASMEGGEQPLAKLWEDTKQWSLAEFKRIYAWLDCRFDHDFFESECGEPSREMVKEFHEKGVLETSNGAIVANLTEHKLGYCVLLKSNGTGLYATKDLHLARIKFDTFNVDKSMYIVDSAQTLHFQQVFKTLELMGYEQATKCVHLPYGLVVLPHGKMSSRDGTVIFFSQLKDSLIEQINTEFMADKDDWSDEKKAEVAHRISVATIKYGMLNHDIVKNVVFDLKEWTAKSGNTGPYLMYAYTRTQAIKREVEPMLEEKDSKWDPDLITETESAILKNMIEFWPTVSRACRDNSPSPLCDYLYSFCKSFSQWYNKVSVKNAETGALRYNRLQLVLAVGEVIKTGLSLLGITTLEYM